MMRIRAGLVLTVCLLTAAAAPVAGAAGASAVPQAGDWEGVGPHGLPLSFQLANRGGHVVATAVAVGYPGSCPALARDAAAVPFNDPSYAGAGGRSGTGAFRSSPPAVLAGHVPGSKQQVYLSGSFSSAQAGRFSISTAKKVGCGWPDTTLTWRVHRSKRRAVGDGTWTGPLTAKGLVNGHVRLVAGAGGRVVESFTSFFTCVTNISQGNTNVRAVPAYEFVAPNGQFSSPVNGGLVHGHRTTWSGRFSRSGQLTGTVTVFDDCTNHMIRARFTARRTSPAPAP